MGISSIVGNIKNKVSGAVGKVAGVAGDVVTKVSVLSPKQVEEIANKKSEYFTELISHDMGTKEATELANRLLGNVSVEIYNAYLSQISDIYVPIDNNAEYGTKFNSNFNIRYINVTKWVTDKSENSLEKLVNVYEVLSNENCNIALIFNRKINGTEVYLGVVNKENDSTNDKVETYADRIIDAIKGNFPGSICSYDKKENSGRIPIFDNKHLSVASISNIPTEKSDKFNTQTIEKLIDGIVPDCDEKEWTLVLLASPILDKNERKLKIGEYYSALKPYKEWETNYTFLENKANTSAAALGINLGGSSGVQSSTSDSQTYKHTTSSPLDGLDGVIDIIGFIPIAGQAAAVVKVGFGAIKAGIGMVSGIAENLKNGKGAFDSSEKVSLDSTTHTETQGRSKSKNFGAHFMRASAQTATIGKNEGIVQHFENYNIKHTLDMLEEQMNRIELSSALGLWDFAAYVLSEDVNIANNVAHSYLALTQGEKSYLAEANVNLWRGDLGENSKEAKEIVEYIKDLRHPIFGIDPTIINNDSSFAVYPTAITATTELTGKELAYSLNFPKKSVAGLPIIECAEFGRSITYLDDNSNNKDKIEIGNIYHMQHVENSRVNLSINNLRKHTFICGDNYSGKTTVGINIVSEVLNNNKKVLIIELESDEYSNIFLKNNKHGFVKYGLNDNDKKLGIDLMKPKDNENIYTNPLVKEFNNNNVEILQSIFNGTENSIENILNNNSIIDLSNITSGEIKSFVTICILQKINAYLCEKNNANEDILNHLIVIDDFQKISEIEKKELFKIDYNNIISSIMGKFRKMGEGLIVISGSVMTTDVTIIKNTNNKIIYRLTNEEEGRIAGKSIGLNDLQIEELAKLKNGISVVYQNEWIQPVLCQVNRHYVKI